VKQKQRARNGATKAKLPVYLDVFNWSKLHQETRETDIPLHVVPYTRDLSPELSLLSSNASSRRYQIKKVLVTNALMCFKNEIKQSLIKHKRVYLNLLQKEKGLLTRHT